MKKKFRKSIYEPEQVHLREWLVTKRNEAGLTQRQLADRLQVVRSMVGKTEKGERRLDILEFVTYCKAMDAEPCEYIKLFKKELSQ